MQLAECGSKFVHPDDNHKVDWHNQRHQRHNSTSKPSESVSLCRTFLYSLKLVYFIPIKLLYFQDELLYSPIFFDEKFPYSYMFLILFCLTPWLSQWDTFCVCDQPMRDDVTMKHCLSLAGCIHKIISVLHSKTRYLGSNWWYDIGITTIIDECKYHIMVNSIHIGQIVFEWQ